MPRNGSGTFTLSQSAFVPGTTISSANVNSDFSDIATALTASICSDGQTPISGQLKFPNGSAVSPSHTFVGDTTTGLYLVAAAQMGVAIAGVEVALFGTAGMAVTAPGGNYLLSSFTPLIPAGVIVPYAGASTPAGWFLCAGQSFAAASYPELSTAIGTTYGGTVTNPLVPDLRGRAPFGKDNMGGAAANRITVAGGNFDGTVLGGSGGTQNVTVGQTNLPNVNFTVSGTVNITDLGHVHNLKFGLQAVTAGGVNVVSTLGVGSQNASVDSHTTGITAALSATTAASGGSGTALGSMNPAFILNYIIFAGRP